MSKTISDVEWCIFAMIHEELLATQQVLSELPLIKAIKYKTPSDTDFI